MRTFQVKYFNNGKYSHEYTESWDKTELFCPACGKQDVHVDTGAADYYAGEYHLCAACGAGFHFSCTPEPHPINEQDRQRLAAIRGISNTESRVDQTRKESHV